MLRVTVWNENLHDQSPDIRAIYPQGLHGEIAGFLKELDGVEVRTATLDQPDCGLPDEVLENTDVLLWWGHMAHEKVPDELARRVADRVLRGMGFIPLHSAHMSKPFRLLMGTSGALRWRAGEFERIWCVNPSHPIAAGIPACFVLEHEEMYGELFDIPQPDEQVFIGWYRGGEVFRSGNCWHRGAGKIFYWQPGHESDLAFKNPYCRRIISNAVRWAAPAAWRPNTDCIHYAEGAEQRYAAGITEETYD